MIYSWIAVSLLTLAVASSLAEICSAYPVAGGQYSWVMVLAPKSIARGMSWITGWFMITGILAMAATTSFVGANFILGMANLSYPGYAIKQWHTVLASYSVALLAALANLFGSHLLERMSKVMMVWNIASFFVVVITILACNDHKQPASFVFAEFQNLTGWGPAMAGLLGVLQSAFGMYYKTYPPSPQTELANTHLGAAMTLQRFVKSLHGLHSPLLSIACIMRQRLLLTEPFPNLAHDRRNVIRHNRSPQSHHPLRRNRRPHRPRVPHRRLLLHWGLRQRRFHTHWRTPHPNILRLHILGRWGMRPGWPFRCHCVSDRCFPGGRGVEGAICVCEG